MRVWPHGEHASVGVSACFLGYSYNLRFMQSIVASCGWSRKPQLLHCVPSTLESMPVVCHTSCLSFIQEVWQRKTCKWRANFKCSWHSQRLDWYLSASLVTPPNRMQKGHQTKISGRKWMDGFLSPWRFPVENVYTLEYMLNKSWMCIIWCVCYLYLIFGVVTEHFLVVSVFNVCNLVWCVYCY